MKWTASAAISALGISALIMLFCLGAGSSALAQCRTYTLDADFDEGVLYNVNHESPNNDQLQLNTRIFPFPFVNIACSNRGTAVRIDVNTGQVLGEYWTSPSGRGRNPSRTTVDLMGNVWVANRDESEGGKGSVVRIGLVIGGTRVDADGTPNPNGQYLKPPFDYSTVVDRDGDGLIKTSRGLGDVLPWSNAGGVDNDGGVSTAEDECIINYVRVTGTNTRTVAIDKNNNAWVGGLGDYDHECVDGATGLPIPGTQFNLGCGGYGGLIDRAGVLWSARGGSGLLRYDIETMSGASLGFSRGDYGLGVDPNNGHIWHTFLNGNMVAELAPDGGLLHIYSHGSYYAQGVAVDNAGNVWVAHSLVDGSTTVGHLRTDGLFVGNVVLPGGSGPTGVAIDANGKVWVANYYSHNAMRIDPSAGPVGGGGYTIGAVDLTVDLNAAGGAPAYPYNYSDMTGFVVVSSTAPQGTWTLIYDGGASGTNWGRVCWNQEACAVQPEGAGITARVRTSDDQITWSEWEDADNCVDVTSPDGQYLQVEMKLTPNEAGESPVLCDVTICTGVEKVLVDIKPQSCPNPLNIKSTQTGITEEDPGSTSTQEKPGPAVSPPPEAVIPVAILGTADFDVYTIDPATVQLEGVPVLRWAYEDVSTPMEEGSEECACNALADDGYMDLTLKFDRTAVINALGAVSDGQIIPLTVTGMLFSGVHIEGFDCMVIRGFKDGGGGYITPPLLTAGNYPNPFNPATTIIFDLPAAAQVTVAVYNLLGQKIAALVDGYLEAGRHSVEWNATDLPSGLYFYRVQAGEIVFSKKMVLLK